MADMAGIKRMDLYEHCHALSLIYDADLTIDQARAGLRDAPMHVVRRIKESALEMRESDGWDVANLVVACEERLDDMQPRSEAEIEKLRANYKKALDLLCEVSNYTLRNGITLGHYSTVGTPENLSKRIERFVVKCYTEVE
tara:strand:- start:3200 stop:3622 length:423 start_codon:yes stop_codon:yes gene_type:complete